jgi:hypothetical protein
MGKKTNKHGKIQKLREELSRYDHMMRGSMVKRYHKCGKKNCICHKDPYRLHGPYYYYTRKEKGKTVGKVCSAEESEIIKPCLKSYKAVTETVREISEISEQIIFDEITTKRKERHHYDRTRHDKHKQD